MSSVESRQCSVGVLDTNDDPDMTFDDLGRSHYYNEYKSAEAKQVLTGETGKVALNGLAEQIKRDGQGKPYDCIMGASGGVDSTYVALKARELGLRPLAVHLDNGWNSELAVQNIENIVSRLDMDLHTHVIDWKEFRDLQLSYLKASVIDIEVITDHAIFALLYRLAGQYGIKHILSGTNVVTEFVMPPHWIYHKSDHINIKAIHHQFGTIPLTTFPFMDLKVKKWYQMVKKVRSHSILNWMPYDKKQVKQTIMRELDWRDYGGKHYESVFTRFYQGYILPRKFGVDKRKAHLSNLIFSGQITKDEALAELQQPPMPIELAASDLEYVTKKLGLSNLQFEEFMSAPSRRHQDFATERSVYEMYPYLRPLRGGVNQLKRFIVDKSA
jgi:N-acetyl sugar amidotransferase